MATKTIEQWAQEKSTPSWLLAATKAANRWGEGKELEEAEFVAQVGRVGNFQYHSKATEPAKPSEATAPASATAEKAPEAVDAESDRAHRQKR